MTPKVLGAPPPMTKKSKPRARKHGRISKHGLIARGALACHLPGHKVLAAFVAEFERGVIVRTETTEKIVRAFRDILRGRDVATALKLKRGRGRREASIGEQERVHGDVWNFIERAIDSRQPHTDIVYHQAVKGAIKAAETHFGGDERTIQRSWQLNEPFHKLKYQFDGDADRLRHPRHKRVVKKGTRK